MDKLKFSSGSFTVLQVSDAQDLHFVRRAMIKMLEKAYDTVMPDLVVFTGDNILGNHLLDRRFGSGKIAADFPVEYERMKIALSHILSPVEKRKIPFTAIFGNHDDRNTITKEEQADIFRSYPHFRGFDNTDSAVRFGSFRLPVYSSDGQTELLNFYLIDSAYYDKANDKCFENVSADTVKWLADELKKHSEIQSLVFQHIPFPEIERIIEECDYSDKNTVYINNAEKGRYIRLRKASARGFLGEFPGHTSENYGEFDVLNDSKNIAGIVFGHDHLNCFEGKIDNVRVMQTPGASFRSYGNRRRGVRVFIFNEYNPSEYMTYTLSYSDLCGDTPVQKLRYMWDADDYEKKKLGFLISFGITVSAAITLAFNYKNRKNNN